MANANPSSPGRNAAKAAREKLAELDGEELHEVDNTRRRNSGFVKPPLKGTKQLREGVTIEYN